MLEALLNNTVALGMVVIFFIALIPFMVFAIIQNNRNSKSTGYANTASTTVRYSDRFRANGHSTRTTPQDSFDYVTSAAVTSAIMSSNSGSCDSPSSSDGGCI